jgi:hypothetical protein
MNVLSKKTERQRDINIALAAGEMFLIAGLLTADDIFGLTDELSDRFINGYSEMINGYVQCGGVEAMKAELADRGISLILDGKEIVKKKSNQHQRGIGEWITITDENGNKKTVCSHCKKGDAIKKPYCGWCGAEMRGAKDA